MKPRSHRPRAAYPVLGVLSLTAACSRAPEAAPIAVHEPTPTHAAPEAAASTPRQADAALSEADQAKLDALRTELREAGRAKALAAVAHFRPLCDADGYPLVGNAVRKVPEPEFQPSELCAEVRKGAR